MKIMLVAGEASGDMHGAHLARALLEQCPGARLFGMGGTLMREAGVRILFDPTKISAMGFTEVLRSVQLFRRLLARVSEALERQAPDALVLIDFPEFNMRLGHRAKELGVPVVYYFSPSAWAWRRGRAKTVAQQAATVCAVFPFEADVYREAGANVEFVGHPLVDIVKAGCSREEARRDFNCAGADPVIALLPGSRNQEVDTLTGALAGAAKRLKAEYPNAAFLLPLAHTLERSRVEAKLGDVDVAILEGRTYDVLTAADAAVAASGTVTLEAALLGTPLVAVYRVSSSTYWIARRLYKGEYVTLPNIVAGRGIIAELLQDDVNPERIAAEVKALLDPERRNAVLAGYREVRERLGGPGAVGRAADAVLRAARKRSTEPAGASSGGLGGGSGSGRGGRTGA